MNSIKKSFGKIFKKAGIFNSASNLFGHVRLVIHFIVKGPLFRFMVLQSFYKNSTRKIHLGCGERKLPGWLNADIYTGDIYIDLNKKLPFKNDSIDYVYSHHVIEHFEQEKAIFQFKELYRICRKNALVRFVTPNLDYIVEAFRCPDQYRDVIEFYCKNAPTKFIHPTEFLNLAMRQLGEHKYLYNFDFLRTLLEQAGFHNVQKKEYGKSEDSVFDKLDFHGYEMIDRISLAVEAEKL